jgi:tRNA modification GTPase
VAETANLGGIPLRLVDTAGVREALDEVEKLGVERTFSAIADSDLRLMVVDASEPWTDEDAALFEKLRPLGSLLIALNKSDLPSQVTEVEPGFSPAPAALKGGATTPPEAGESLEPDVQTHITPAAIVLTSALTGQGIHDLKEKILVLAAPGRDTGPEGEFITNLRHQQLIKTSLVGLAKARQAAQQQTPHEMLLLDLYDALRPLDLITGATYADDVLDIIFKTFCVGK